MESTGQDIIDGYRLRKQFPTGQTSQVYAVVEIQSNRHFAMKILLPEMAKNALQRKMLFHEAEVGKQLSHPNIIRIFKVSRSATTPHFIMEFFPSGSLRTRLVAKEMAFVHQHLQGILKQAATGLAFMNASGWVHRDVKPDNILVNATGDAKLIDFALAARIPSGLAKLFHRRGKSQGTRSYMSPEQILGKPLDAQADIYSFGCTTYELATGRPPFRGKDMTELLQKHFTEKALAPKNYNPNITDEFSAYILQLISKKKTDRPKDFHEVLMAIRNMRLFKEGPKPPGEIGE